MKKILFSVSLLALVAAGCNNAQNQPQSSQNNTSAETQTRQNAGGTDYTPGATKSIMFADLTMSIPKDWAVEPSTKNELTLDTHSATSDKVVLDFEKKDPSLAPSITSDVQAVKSDRGVEYYREPANGAFYDIVINTSTVQEFYVVTGSVQGAEYDKNGQLCDSPGGCMSTSQDVVDQIIQSIRPVK